MEIFWEAWNQPTAIQWISEKEQNLFFSPTECFIYYLHHYDFFHACDIGLVIMSYINKFTS